ncbi:hypothetical protein PPUJ13061_55740 [Pseudomonas putida]|nr:hypothetical protein PPUJ13061_55740 [Pseudomonas putida]
MQDKTPFPSWIQCRFLQATLSRIELIFLDFEELHWESQRAGLKISLALLADAISPYALDALQENKLGPSAEAAPDHSESESIVGG